MHTNKKFSVFGEEVEILVSSEATNGSFCILTQTSPPGGGPPPHRHTNEDEIFTVIEGEFELFDGAAWRRIPAGEHVYALRGQTHTFRNCGQTLGKILCIAMPGGFERYLEDISLLAMPQDHAHLLDISTARGISFVLPDGRPARAAVTAPAAEPS